MERQLTRPEQTDEDQDAKPILIVSCQGTDEKLVKSIKKYEDDAYRSHNKLTNKYYSRKFVKNKFY